MTMITTTLASATRTLLLAGALGISTLASAQAQTCFDYRVNLRGVVSGNFGGQQFSGIQRAIVRQPGVAGNPYELILTTGRDLNASARIGDLELMTNSAFANNPGMASARFDLARVSVGNGFAQFQLDPAANLQLPPPNVLVAPGVGTSTGGLGGICFVPGLQDLCRDLSQATVLQAAFLVPQTGGGYFYFPDGRGGSIAGGLDIAGAQIDNPNNRAQYRAEFHGRLVNSRAC
jgi:hypothetical protein